MSSKTGPDKRRYLRYEILDYAVVSLGDGAPPTNTVIVDISLGGIQLRAKQPLPVGGICMVRVGCADLPPLSLRGEVRHCMPVPESDLYTSGIRFVPESHADRMSIAEYVHAIFQRQCDNMLA